MATSAISIGLISVKLRRDLKYRDHVYFEPVHLHTQHQTLAYLKYNEFYEDASIAKKSVTTGHVQVFCYC